MARIKSTVDSPIKLLIPGVKTYDIPPLGTIDVDDEYAESIVNDYNNSIMGRPQVLQLIK